MSGRKRLTHTVSLGQDAEMAAALGHYVNAECGYRWIPTLFDEETAGLDLCPSCHPPEKPGRTSRRFHDRARPHYIYRCYTADDVLIYVGCTSNPVARLAQHRQNAWWADQISHTRLTVFPDRRYALSKEREAIALEGPRWNVKGRWAYRTDRWVAADYVDLRTAIVQAVETTHGMYGTTTTRILHELDEELERRFGITAISRRHA